MTTVLPGERVRPARVRRPRRPRRPRLRDVVAVAGGVVGALCLVATLVAAALGGSVLVVRTGSMQPHLPVGSVLLVRPVAVGAVRTGDVVGARRPAGSSSTGSSGSSRRAVAGPARS